jgi:Spy/CpxP family protein refolding chaperone
MTSRRRRNPPAAGFHVRVATPSPGAPASPHTCPQSREEIDMNTRPSRFTAAALGATLLAGAVALVAARPAAGSLGDEPSFDSSAFAPEPGGGSGPGRPGHLRRGFDAARVAAYLRLSEAQKTTIRSLVESHRSALEPLVERRRALHDELRGLMEQESPDQAAIGDVMLRLRAERRRFEESRDELADEIAAHLDAEQQVKWQHLRELRQAGRDQRRPRRG